MFHNDLCFGEWLGQGLGRKRRTAASWRAALDRKISWRNKGQGKESSDYFNSIFTMKLPHTIPIFLNFAVQ
ncbi:hypothetical protein [Eubacterium sp. ER2]|uniref:hypothetical protein n=1 Tax=Eubacterium sp. ER2 TaxID=1519438 RepID=UPI00051C673A|nr:hypothetical protein [Eubacterium sp. ER2]